ncbi:2Fe-2S iron-sulfur cluster-binding protein [Methylobrevis pamukkalensis]|uniref:Ferredoxin-1 n=1 Tax=Methylobrevis pamukkalensis TaxID=1439726 RepID=A0A1E3H7V0_9HYPH|nr:2Fe-2S iron-sulfur cluster binding domain-containing protein [Methylobrevis pamukkalensis]ODN72393.1 Ferredoxin-1 [Methylobrevis pamukkalensis]
MSDEITVTFSKAGIEAPWDPECESLLDFAEEQGLTPPFSCRGGICNTCRQTLVSGEITYFEEPLDPPEEGFLLMCCSRPVTSVVIAI